MIGIELKGIKSEHLNGIYKDIADNFGLEIAMRMFEQYRGLQVTFPTRLLCPQQLRDRLCAEYTGSNISELARKYNYSSRWVRELVTRGRTEGGE
ncbi:MAG: Mor transcription activator family protein [Thermaerobacter sp.]|nr:Mor transcription activator family protein [Thermaerobacter sp.]